MSQTFQFTVEPTDQGARFDKFLAEKMPDYSRAILQKLIKDKKILLNGRGAKASAKLKAEDIITVELKESKIDLSPDPSVKFKIIREEKDFAVIDKPAGLVVYPGTKHNEKTLVSGLLALWPEIRNVGDPEYSGLRPGIVHRLDKDTSGLMIIAKNNAAFKYFKNLFKERKVEKIYTALVFGHIMNKEGKIDFPVRRSKSNPVKQVAVTGDKARNKAREAITYFKTLKYFSDKKENQYTLVEVKPKTGRMHQIRVHFAAIGHPVVGDKIYQAKKTNQLPEISRQLLHASAIKFFSPSGEEIEFISPLPNDFSSFLKTLEKK